MSGKPREELITGLIGRGILRVGEKETLDALANKIFTFLWTKVESSIQGLSYESDESRYIARFFLKKNTD